MDVELNLEGEDGQITMDNFHGAMGELLDLLSEAASIADVPRQSWRISSLRTGSAHVAMAAPEGSSVAALIRDGLDALRETPAIPAGWSRSMVKHVWDLGKRVGTGGTTSVTLRLGSRHAKTRDVDSRITEHAERALGGASATHGSVRGTVDRWNEHGRREVGLSSADGGTFPASYRRELSARIQAEAIGHDIEAWGTIRRNVMGQITGMTVEDFRVLEPAMSVSIESLVGVYASDEGESAFTLEQWLEDRRADD